MRITTVTYQSKSNRWDDIKKAFTHIQLEEKLLNDAFYSQDVEKFLSIEKRLGVLYKDYMKLIQKSL